MSGKRKTIAQNTSQTTKKSKVKVQESKFTDAEYFGKIYGWAIYNSAYLWNFHSDSGCFYETCLPETCKKGPWTAIYQPSKTMKEGDDGRYYIIITYSKNVTSQLRSDITSYIQKVEDLFMESYHDILKITNNRWSEKIQKGTFQEVAHILSPLEFNGKVFKMCLNLRGYKEHNSNDSWEPVKLGLWLGYKKTYTFMDDEGKLIPNTSLNNDGVPDEIDWFTEPVNVKTSKEDSKKADETKSE